MQNINDQFLIHEILIGEKLDNKVEFAVRGKIKTKIIHYLQHHSNILLKQDLVSFIAKVIEDENKKDIKFLAKKFYY